MCVAGIALRQQRDQRRVALPAQAIALPLRHMHAPHSIQGESEAGPAEIRELLQSQQAEGRSVVRQKCCKAAL